MQRAAVAAVLCVAALVACAGAAAQAAGCTFASGGVEYNLCPLVLPTSNAYQEPDAFGDVVLFNIVNPTDKCNGSYACFASGGVIGNQPGQFSANSVPSTGGQLRYTGPFCGDPGDWWFNINFVCDASTTFNASAVYKAGPACHYGIDVRSKYACPTAPSKCSYTTSSGKHFDFSGLTLKSGVAYKATDSVGQQYDANICATVTSPCTGAAVCQVDSRGNSHSAGALPAKFSEGDNSIDLSYDHGDACGSTTRRSTIHLVCDASAKTPQFAFITESPACQYSFSLRSAYACPQ